MLFGLHGGGVAGKAPPLVLAVPSVGVRRQVDEEPAGDPGGEAIAVAAAGLHLRGNGNLGTRQASLRLR
jgi:hypothetical protein